MAGRLYRMAKVVSANPKSWGIVDANEISGFKRVAKLSDLYSIAECILSSSYGDGVTDGADAVGQIWHVSETNDDYKLTNWAKRKSAEGWTKLYSDEELIGGIFNEIRPTIEELQNKDETFENSINSLKSQIDVNKSQIDANTSNLNWVVNHYAKPEGFASLDEKGFVPLKQLGNLDTILFEVVSELPNTIATIKKHIYLKTVGTTGDNNKYAEYIYTGDLTSTAAYDATKWEKLGEVAAKTDLSGYYKKTEVYNKGEIDNKVTTINNSINNNAINTFTAVPYVAARPGEEHEDQYKLNISLHNGTNKTAYIKPATNSESGVMTSTQKVKLDGIAVGANNYVHPSYTSTPTKALYKINVDGFGHVSGYTEVTNTDIDQLITVDSTLDIHSSHPVSGNAVNKYINNKKLTTDNLTDNNNGVISDGNYVIPYALINGNGDNKLRYDENAFVMHCEGSTINLRINGTSLWNDSNLTALTDTELNNILK